MKCLIINGSPRKGNTWALVEAAKGALNRNGDVTFEEVHLKASDIPMCNGCFNCIIRGEDKCPHNEKVQSIVDKIIDNDILIIACPVYSLSITALLKNFIDHMSYNFHRPRFYNKRALVLTTTVGAGARKIAMYIRDVLKFWGVNRVYTADIACFTDSGYKPSVKMINKIEKISDRIYRDYKDNRIYRPTWKRAVYYNIWRAISQIDSYEKSADHRYWKDSGLVNKPYYSGVPISFCKRGVGNMLYKIFSKKFKPTDS